jgi:hypothetical protein
VTSLWLLPSQYWIRAQAGIHPIPFAFISVY